MTSTRSEAEKRAQAKYAKKQVPKKAVLHAEKDSEIIRYIEENIPNFTDWVRRKVKQEMKQQ